MTARRPLGLDEDERQAEAGFDARRRLAALEAEVARHAEALRAIMELLETGAARATPPPPPEPASRLPLAAVARRLGLPISTMRRWCRDGRLEALAIPGPGRRLRWSVSRQAVEALERGALGAPER